jgi:hypothetical protein
VAEAPAPAKSSTSSTSSADDARKGAGDDSRKPADKAGSEGSGADKSKSRPAAPARAQGPASSAGQRVGSLAASAASGKRLVVVGTIGTGALALIASYRRPDDQRASPFRIVVGTFAAGTILAVVAEVAPGIAGGFAMLMLVTAAFVVGADTWAGVKQVTAPPAAARASGFGGPMSPVTPGK